MLNAPASPPSPFAFPPAMTRLRASFSTPDRLVSCTPPGRRLAQGKLRSIRSYSPAFTSPLLRLRSYVTNDAMDQRALFFGGCVRNLVALFDEGAGTLQALGGVVVDGAQWLFGRHLVADFLVNYHPHGGINRIFFALTAATQQYACGSQLFAKHRRHEPGSRTGDVNPVLGLGQPLGVVDSGNVPAL